MVIQSVKELSRLIRDSYHALLFNLFHRTRSLFGHLCGILSTLTLNLENRIF